MSGMSEPHTQRTIIEPYFHAPLAEGEKWFAITTDWMDQWKRYVGLLPQRQYSSRYSSSSADRSRSSDRSGNRNSPTGAPGPITTTKEGAHGVEMLPADAWTMLLGWYGLEAGHKAVKKVVYMYSDKLEIEQSLNQFKVVLANSLPEVTDKQALKFSKRERIGHVEWKIRDAFHVKRNVETRLWGKSLDCADTWIPLFNREKPIGKEMEVDSDYTKPELALELCDSDHIWRGKPPHASSTQENPVGKLLKHTIFEDVTTSWEKDVHDQLDIIGKGMMTKLHQSFNNFLNRARDHMTERELNLQESERMLENKEREIQDKMNILEEREVRLGGQISQHNAALAEFRREKDQLMKDLDAGRLALEEDREAFEREKEAFDAELEQMSQMHKLQESRVKLDVGGQLFTTSLVTLEKEKQSLLASMFSGRHALEKEADGSYFIDRDGTHFRFILNYLRDGELKEGTLPTDESILREILHEAEHYNLKGFVAQLRVALSNNSNKQSSHIGLGSTTSSTFRKSRYT